MKGVGKFIVGVVLALGVMSPASAAILEVGADNNVFFEDFENLYNSDGQLKAPGSTPVVGDYLAGIIKIQNIEVDGLDIFNIGPQNQLSGIFAQQIVSIFPPGADPFNPLNTRPHVQLGTPTLTTFCSGADCFSTGLAAGEMFRIFLQQGPGTTPFESNGTLADDVAKATDGALWVSLGLGLNNGAGPDGIFGTPDDTGYFYSHPDLLVNPADGVAFGALNVIFNGTGTGPFLGLNDPGESELGGFTLFTHLYLNSQFEVNPNTRSPWKFSSNDPAVIHPVPEVSSLWMLGMGLTGLVSRRRRKTASAA